MSSLVQSGGIRDWTIYNWCYACNIINMNCFQKKFYSKHVSLYDKGHYMQHDMLIKLLEWRRRQVTSSNVKRRHWHKMSVSLHAGLINLQLRHCGHFGIKLIRKVCSITIWENVIFEIFVTKVPFRLTLLICFTILLNLAEIILRLWQDHSNLTTWLTSCYVIGYSSFGTFEMLHIVIVYKQTLVSDTVRVKTISLGRQWMIE